MNHDDEERKRKYNEQREERNAKRRAKYREEHPEVQRVHYTSPEERAETMRLRRRARMDMIRRLLNEYRHMHGHTPSTAVREPAAVRQQEEIAQHNHKAAVKHYATLLANEWIRKAIMRAMIDGHYDEAKEQMDAYRLLKDK